MDKQLFIDGISIKENDIICYSKNKSGVSEQILSKVEEIIIPTNSLKLKDFYILGKHEHIKTGYFTASISTLESILNNVKVVGRNDLKNVFKTSPDIFI